MDPCIEWTSRLDRDGYGRYGAALAHRLVYTETRGTIPDGLELDHLCRNRACVNPDHLEPVTHAENVRRSSLAKTHCKRGHEFTPENTYRIPGRQSRSCRVCNLAAVKRYQARRAAA